MTDASNVKFVGVDWAIKGWFAIGFDEAGDYDMAHGSFRSIVDRYSSASMILVDIPIGIPRGQMEGRLCDQAARETLGPRFSSSVFRVATREAMQDRMVKGLTRAQAHEREAIRTGGPGINSQSWGIIPQIAEVDEVMPAMSEGQQRIREVHPEVCFWALNGNEPMPCAKTTLKGYYDRLKILRTFEQRTDEIVESALPFTCDNRAAADDILDALAAAVTARLGYPDKLKTLPETPPKDEHGLRMEMVFYNPPT